MQVDSGEVIAQLCPPSIHLHPRSPLQFKAGPGYQSASSKTTTALTMMLYLAAGPAGIRWGRVDVPISLLTALRGPPRPREPPSRPSRIVRRITTSVEHAGKTRVAEGVRAPGSLAVSANNRRTIEGLPAPATAYAPAPTAKSHIRNCGENTLPVRSSEAITANHSIAKPTASLSREPPISDCAACHDDGDRRGQSTAA